MAICKALLSVTCSSISSSTDPVGYQLNSEVVGSLAVTFLASQACMFNGVDQLFESLTM